MPWIRQCSRSRPAHRLVCGRTRAIVNPPPLAQAESGFATFRPWAFFGVLPAGWTNGDGTSAILCFVLKRKLVCRFNLHATFRVLILVPPGPTDRMVIASFLVSLET